VNRHRERWDKKTTSCTKEIPVALHMSNAYARLSKFGKINWEQQSQKNPQKLSITP